MQEHSEEQGSRDPSSHPQSTVNMDTSFVGASPTIRLAEKNVLTGIGTIETADSATTDIKKLLERGRELAHQSTEELLSSRERSFLQNESLN